MKKIRFYLAIAFTRFTRAFMNLLGYRASHTPGVIALKLCPDFLSFLEKPPLLIAVTGTNGKTTTANMLADIYRGLGQEVVNNGFGSNIKEGVITSLLDATNFFGSSKVDTAILEVDERASRIIFPEMAPDYLIVTNLFRESYLRNAHGEFIFRVLDDHIPSSTRLILNSDDPLSFRLGKDNEKIFYSIDQLEGEVSEEKGLINDLPICPDCHSPLDYDFRRYHHIGRLSCQNCGFENPQALYKLVDDKESFVLESRGKKEEYPLIGDNVLNHYAQLAALALLRELGYKKEDLALALQDLEVIKSRKDVRKVGGKTLYKMLAKGMNPVAISRALSIIIEEEGSKAVILLNDTSEKDKSHEENTAWLYDTDFELLKSDDIKQILVGGYRAQDYLMRLVFAGIDREKIYIKEEKTELLELIDPQVDFVGILYELYSEEIAENITNQLSQKFQEESC